MSTLRTLSRNPSFSPLDPANRSLGFQAVAVLGGTLALAASSQVAVPMVPVPMTMQTLAVTLIGAVYGWRLGALTVLAWLIEGVIGLPVLANGASGLPYMVGKTGGFLFSFPLAAALTGWLAERGWNGGRSLKVFFAMLAANALCLVIGGAWLAAMIGAPAAFALGVAPFVPGAVLKSVLGAAVLRLTCRHRAVR